MTHTGTLIEFTTLVPGAKAYQMVVWKVLFIFNASRSQLFVGKLLAFAVFFFGSLALFAEPLRADPARLNQFQKNFQAALANPENPKMVDDFIRELPEVPLGSGNYIVEGDIGLNREEIQDYLRSFRKGDLEGRKSIELIVGRGPGGDLDYLVDVSSRKLTYAIDRASFANVELVDEIAQRLRMAMNEWTNACLECGIEFQERSEQDAGLNFSQVWFVVRYLDDPRAPYAQSFFPSSPPEKHALTIFPKYFSPTMMFDKTGILRHELGHILGYRHEHKHNLSGCRIQIDPNDNVSFESLTSYTPNSVMHYFCGVGGSFDLSLRASDIQGHRCLYLTGKPCGTIRLDK